MTFAGQFPSVLVWIAAPFLTAAIVALTVECLRVGRLSGRAED